MAISLEKSYPKGRGRPQWPDPGDVQVIDVREIAPCGRHELIFDTWFALPAGGAFQIVNNHDPKPLYYQFQAEHPGQVTWEYIEEGPEVWQVKIGKIAN